MTPPSMEIEPSFLHLAYLLHLNIIPDAMSFKKMQDLCDGYLKIWVKEAAMWKLTPKSLSELAGASGSAFSHSSIILTG
jgi:hypothetical protein